MGIERTALLLAAIAGFTGVAFGAFGAHIVRSRLASRPDGEQRLRWWEIGSQYHLVHALAIGLAAVRPSPVHGGSLTAAWLFVVGILLFAGSLYTMSLTGIRKLGAVTPLGGLTFLAGWSVLAYNALKIVD